MAPKEHRPLSHLDPVTTPLLTSWGFALTPCRFDLHTYNKIVHALHPIDEKPFAMVKGKFIPEHKTPPHGQVSTTISMHARASYAEAVRMGANPSNNITEVAERGDDLGSSSSNWNLAEWSHLANLAALQASCAARDS